MPITEYYSWIAFYEIEPFGDYRADLRAGVVASTIAKMLGAKGAKPKPLDYMPIVKAGLERQKAARGEDTTAELRGAILESFKGRMKVVKIRREAH